jgi:putative oxygen-independent coproporphyrinogen III oxidase
MDFFDRLKSRFAAGYASLDYEFSSATGVATWSRWTFCCNGEPVDALSSASSTEDKAVFHAGRQLAEKLKEGHPPAACLKSPFKPPSATRSSPGRRSSALRKDVLAKCYGGDVTRKRKLLEKQKEGKKRMKQLGTGGSAAGGVYGHFEGGLGWLPMGVYVHIPFCEQKCHYCDFHSVVVSDQDRLSVTGSYLVSLHKEARYWSSVWGGEALFALFVGGGTPTVLPAEELADLIAFLRTELPFVDDPEITIEANPHSLTYMGARLLRQAGVNRVSLGVQAFQDHLLRGIGRIHSAEQARESVQTLKKAGLTNINLDLMFGLPGQTSHEWADTLRQTVALGPSHISCYSLILEEGTPMEKWVREGLVHVPGDDQQAEMYALACKMLTKAGYEHYEISNFSEPGFSCRHNLLYWHNKPFIAWAQGLQVMSSSAVTQIPQIFRSI